MHMAVTRKWVVGFMMVKVLEVLVLTFFLTPSARAADTEAAESPVAAAVDLEHMRSEIAAEQDPELRAAMEEQFQLLESGQLDVQTLEREMARGAPTRTGETGGTGGRPAETLPGGGLLGPPIDIGTGGGTAGGTYLPPEAQAELEKIFSQGTGDPSKDGHLREQAEQVLEKYGIEHTEFGNHEGMQGEMTSPREAFQQWEQSEQGQRTDSATREQYREMSEQYQAEFEQRGEGFERAMTEHMAPEAREQMERFMNEREMGGHEMSHEGMEREMMEREFGGPSSERSYEAPTHEYEAQTREYEAPTREYETQSREYEAPTREYETPTREYEAPTHEYETPTREYEAPTREYETQTREYEAPTYEAPTHEYEAPQHEYQSPESTYQY